MINLRAITIGVHNGAWLPEMAVHKKRLEALLTPRTCRFNLTIQSLKNRQRLFGYLEMISNLCNETGTRWFNVPFLADDEGAEDVDFFVSVLRRLPLSFVNLIVARNEQISSTGIENASKVVKRVSQMGDSGFHNFRVGISCNPCPNTPFFPISFSAGVPGFSVALELPGAFGKLIKVHRSLGISRMRDAIVDALVPELVALEQKCRDYESSHGMTYYGIDLSLSPFPDAEQSVAALYELLGLDVFGSNGTLFFTAFFTDILEHIAAVSEITSIGFNGVMLPVLEDAVLSQSNIRHLVSLDSLLSYCSVCGCGLDMVPLPGDTFVEEISSLVLDIAGLSTKLHKPLGIRLLPIPGKTAGEMTTFNMDFLCNTRVMDIKNSVAWNEVFQKESFMFKKQSKELNDEHVKAFWEKKGDENLSQVSAENLKPLWYVYQTGEKEALDSKLEIEQDVVLTNIPFSSDMEVLDLGAGNGYWAFQFSSRVKDVDAVDYCANLVRQGRQIAENSQMDNVHFFECAAQDYCSTRQYGLVFISGVLIYMNDDDVHKAVMNIGEFSAPGSFLFLREGTGIQGRHSILEQHSEALDTTYNAIYRTREEYIQLFEKVGFNLKKDGNFFPEGSEHNKFPETRLRFYLFQKQKSPG